MNEKAPRVVVVSRLSEYSALLERHGTRAQAEFFLKTRAQTLSALAARHEIEQQALQLVHAAIPEAWRRSRVDRRDLASFVFEPEDLVLSVGQDGLVANVAKYLTGQRVLGINPDPSRYEGVLARHRARDARELLLSAHKGAGKLEQRTMVQVRLDDGQRLLALNEIFLGHRSHQSARYRIRVGEREERQSSSGVIVATGTGATGWARSIERERRDPPGLPGPCERGLVLFVREAFPSVDSGASLTEALCSEAESFELTSEMNDAGVVFGDGMEEDRLEFVWGVRARISVAAERLLLVA